MAESHVQQRDYHQGKGSPSSSQLLAMAAIVPFGASLLILAGFTLTATVIGLAVATPLFVIFSPVLIPAALVIGLAVAGFVTSGAFGVTSLSSFAWMASYFRHSRLPEQLQHAKARARETLGNLAAQRNETTKEVSESGISKAWGTVQEDQSKARAQETLDDLAQRNETTKEVSESGISKAQGMVQKDQSKARAQETPYNLAQRNETAKEGSESGISKARGTLQKDQGKARAQETPDNLAQRNETTKESESGISKARETVQEDQSKAREVGKAQEAKRTS